MATCDDLRLGGTLSSSGISGGTNINSTTISVLDWSQILGTAGISGGLVEVSGRPGGYAAGDLLGAVRQVSLNIRLTGDTDTAKQTNTDTFLGLISDPSGNYLEVDMPDGTSRFVYVYAFDPAPILQPRAIRAITVPMDSPNPYWREGGQESSDTISGADTMSFGGNRSVYDAVLVFAGDGTFTHDDEGWSIEVTGSGGAVTVDLGNRTVTEGGNPAANRIRRSHRDWGWFPPGTNNVTTDVSVGVTWRDAYA